MYKLLLMCDNLNIIKQISNNIIGKLDNVRLIGITTNFNEINKFTLETQAEIIIICNTNHSNLPPLTISNYNPIIIILSDLESDIKKTDNIIFISNNYPLEHILHQIKLYIKQRNLELIHQEVINILKNLKFNFKFLGTHYLLDCIIYSYIHKDSYEFENLEKKVYPYIAEKNKTSAQNVKWAIIRAINNMYLNHTTQTFHIIEDYFCISFPEKPTNKLIIGTIVNRLKNSNMQ